MAEATALEIEQIKSERELLKWHIVLSLREIQTNFPTIFKAQQHQDWFAAEVMISTLNSLLTKYTTEDYRNSIKEIQINLKKYLGNADKAKYFEELNKWLEKMNKPFSYAGVYPPIEEDPYDMGTPDEKKSDARYSAKTYIRYLMSKENKEAVQKLVNEALNDINQTPVKVSISKIVDSAYLRADEKKQTVKKDGLTTS